jgi:DNA-binding response OmpR family regulator
LAVLPPKVLVLDEDVLALELYVRELRDHYQLITRSSVEEARRLLQTEDFDLLIIEPAVNGGEGWALLSEIRAHPHRPVTILCSVEDERKTGLENGADAFMVKPVMMPVLHSLLDQLSAKKPNHLSKERKRLHD